MTLLASPPRPKATTAKVTPEELLRMPDGGTCELVDGRIVEKNVSVESSEVELDFGFVFKTFTRTHPVAKVYPQSLGYRCFGDAPDKIRKPDTTVVRIERVRALDDLNPGFMPIIPDLAVEVISPNDLAREVDEKVREYLEAGFPLVWVANPVTRAITVNPRDGKPVIFTAEDEITAEDALPGFRCKVAEFFASRA